MEEFQSISPRQSAEDFTALGSLLAAAPPVLSPMGRGEAQGDWPVPALSLLPMLQDLAGLVGKVIRADQTGASEVVESGAIVSRAVGVTWERVEVSQTIALGSSPGSDSSLCAYALSAGNMVACADLVTEGRFSDEFLRGLGVRSAVCLPLRPQDKAIATLEFYRLERQPFATDDVQFLEVLSRQSSVLIRQIQDEHAARAKDSGKATRRAPGRRGADLRSSPRRKYPYRQRIAPIVGERIPDKADFFPVWCNDISSGGCSLYLSTPPTFHKLVVALGPAAHVKHYRAEVMHVQPIDLDGRRVYLVGCRFKARVYL